MLERLMSLPLYSKRPGTNRYDSNVLTKLVLNYRSHPAILEVSNNLFYDGELKVNFNLYFFYYLPFYSGEKKKKTLSIN